MFVVQQVPESNLLMLVVQGDYALNLATLITHRRMLTTVGEHLLYVSQALSFSSASPAVHLFPDARKRCSLYVRNFKRTRQTQSRPTAH
ncbi:hypothetical protein AMECASPLE_028811 [Ameca splendens]|uniref:Uncharacterized protein n=1 Tax=Ameca splendens TaxID=208324 RepID=A0ABV1ABW6_9TELE